MVEPKEKILYDLDGDIIYEESAMEIEMNRSEILSKADSLISFDRNKEYGNASKNFSDIAKGFGIPSKRVELMSSLHNQVDWFWKESGPVLLEVMIDPDSDVIPMLLAGQNLDEMWKGRVS